MLVKDIYPGLRGSGPTIYDVDLNGVVLFRAQQGGLGLPGFGVELWRTDGSAGGTYMIADLQPGDQSSSPSDVFTVGGIHYFTAASDLGVFSPRLWRTDGTPSGTNRVMLPDAFDHLGITILAATEQKLIFLAGRRVWSLDATARDVVEIFKYLGALAADGNLLAFGLRDRTAFSWELWVGDGTVEGLSTIFEYDQSPRSFMPQLLTLIDGRMFFSASDPEAGRELWAAAVS